MTLRHFSTPQRVAGLAGLVCLVMVARVGLEQWQKQEAAAGAVSPTLDGTEAEPLTVSVFELKRVDEFTQNRQVTGSLRTRRTSRLSFERGGRITEVLVNDGQQVDADQPMAHLDTGHLLNRKRVILAEIAQAKAQLAELKSGPRPQTIAASQARVTQLNAKASQLQSTLSRLKKLSQRNATTTQQVDDVQFELTAAQQLAAAELEVLNELRAGTRTEQLQAQAAVVEALSAQLADVELDILDCVLRAPYSGTVLSRMSLEGHVVQPGEPVVELTESSIIEARFGLPESLTHVFPSDTSKLRSEETKNDQYYTIEVAGRQIANSFRTILPAVDAQTRTRTAIFDVTGDSSGLAAGQVARLNLLERISVRGFRVPVESLRRGRRGLWTLFVVRPDEGELFIVERRSIEVLHMLGQSAIVRGPELEGVLCVESGIHRVAPGQRVRISQLDRPNAILQSHAEKTTEPAAFQQRASLSPYHSHSTTDFDATIAAPFPATLVIH